MMQWKQRYVYISSRNAHQRQVLLVTATVAKVVIKINVYWSRSRKYRVRAQVHVLGCKSTTTIAMRSRAEVLMAIGLKVASIEKMDHLDTLMTLALWFGIILENLLRVCFQQDGGEILDHRQAHGHVHTLVLKY